jgi:hypothetical protein
MFAYAATAASAYVTYHVVSTGFALYNILRPQPTQRALVVPPPPQQLHCDAEGILSLARVTLKSRRESENELEKAKVGLVAEAVSNLERELLTKQRSKEIYNSQWFSKLWSSHDEDALALRIESAVRVLEYRMKWLN